jgi:hypothetical protein
MVEADSHLKLLPRSTLDVYKVFEHIDMLSMGIEYQPCTVIPTLLGSDFDIAALFVLALLPLLRWCCHFLWHGLLRCLWLSTCQLNEGKDACKVIAQRKHNKGKEACGTRASMPVHQG